METTPSSLALMEAASFLFCHPEPVKGQNKKIQRTAKAIAIKKRKSSAPKNKAQKKAK